MLLNISFDFRRRSACAHEARVVCATDTRSAVFDVNYTEIQNKRSMSGFHRHHISRCKNGLKQMQIRSAIAGKTESANNDSIFRFSKLNATCIWRWSRKFKCTLQIVASVHSSTTENWNRTFTVPDSNSIRYENNILITFSICFSSSRASSASRLVVCTQSNWLNPLQFLYFWHGSTEETPEKDKQVFYYEFNCLFRVLCQRLAKLAILHSNERRLEPEWNLINCITKFHVS